MPRYEYRALTPTPPAEKSFLEWIDKLDQEFMNRDPEHRSDVVRDALHQLYLGRPYTTPAEGLAEQVLTHSFDPRNTTLEPEYYGDVDPVKYAERKPLIWFWMMFDRSPAGLNHWLGYRVRAMLARHIFKHIGKNVKLFHGIEFSYGYNLTIEDNCTIHKYVLLDDRGEIIVHEGSSISDYANVYSHSHDLNDGMIVDNHKTEIGPHGPCDLSRDGIERRQGGRARDCGIGWSGIEGRVSVSTSWVGFRRKPIKVKSIAPEELQKSLEKR